MPRDAPYYEEVIFGGGSLDSQTRRAILGAMGLGGASMIAGCLGDDETDGEDDTGPVGDSDGDGDGDSDIAGDSAIKLSTRVNPEDISFLDFGAFPNLPNFGHGSWVVPPFQDIMMESGMFGRWANDSTLTGEPIFTQYESVDVEPDEVTVQIKDDAVWSDGTPVHGRDCITEQVGFRMFDNIPTPQMIIEDGEAGDIQVSAITDFEFDEDSFTMISEVSGFADILETDIWSHLLTHWAAWGGLRQPTHVEPYDAWADMMWDRWDMLHNGEWTHPLNGGDSFRGIFVEEMDDSNRWPEHLREGENVVTNGAWTLGEIVEDARVELVPNEHHRHADQVDFDRIVIEHRPEQRANWAALQAGELDHFSGFAPRDVVDTLPEVYEERIKPEDSGIALSLDLSHEAWSDVRARWALAYLIDTESVAASQGAEIHEPIKVPGGDVWGSEELIPDEFVEANLRSFESNPERAEALLAEVGWTKEGGEWYLPSGERAEFTLPTTSNTPRWEVAVRDQLTEFGIATEVRTLPSSAYRQRWIVGEFNIYGAGRTRINRKFAPGVGSAPVGLAWSLASMVANAAWLDIHNIYPEDQKDETVWADGNRGRILHTDTSVEGFGGFTVEAPAVGDWDGDTREWELPALAWETWRATSFDVIEENYPKLAWLTNWFMPTVPLFNDYSQQILNTGNWLWPEEESEEWAAVGSQVSPYTLMAKGDMLSVNPDNPK